MPLTLKSQANGSFGADPDEEVFEILNETGIGVGLLYRKADQTKWMHVCPGHYVLGFYDEPEEALSSRSYTPVEEWADEDRIGPHVCGYHPDGKPR